MFPHIVSTWCQTTEGSSLVISPYVQWTENAEIVTTLSARTDFGSEGYCTLNINSINLEAREQTLKPHFPGRSHNSKPPETWPSYPRSLVLRLLLCTQDISDGPQKAIVCFKREITAKAPRTVPDTGTRDFSKRWLLWLGILLFTFLWLLPFQIWN